LVYLTAFRKAYRLNLQYRAAHMINNFGSALFGYVYIAIWQAATAEKSIGPYDASTMTHYIAFAQALLWITTFLRPALGIRDAVRTGTISLEMMRPVNFFAYVIGREAGHAYYNLWFRSAVLVAIFSFTVGMHVPETATLPVLIPSVLLAAYNGLCLAYLVGIAALWTYEVRWAYWLLHSLIFSIGGTAVPVDVLPSPLGQVTAWLPFACLIHHPTRVYLSLAGAEALLPPALWAVLLTGLGLILTRAGRRNMEVQGG